MQNTAQMVPQTACEIKETLVERFDNLPLQVRRAARFIIDNPHDVGLLSMRQLAGRAGVHPNTLTRVAQASGFDRYDAFRERFRDFLVGDNLGGMNERVAWLQEQKNAAGPAGILSQMVVAISSNLDEMWQKCTPAVLDDVVADILKAENVFVLGMGAAQHLAFQFAYVMRMGFNHIRAVPQPGSQPVDDMVHLSKNDLLIAMTFQPYRSDTLTACRLAQKKSAKIIGITDSETSPLVRYSDRHLIVPTHTPQFFPSNTAVLALLEALMSLLVAKGGEKAMTGIRNFHQNRLDAGVYEENNNLAIR